MNIYIATSLTHVPRDTFEYYSNSIHTLASFLLKKYKVKYALINSDPQLESIDENEKARYCYIWDREMVEEADLIIAECSFSSIGLGIELQIAENKNIPIIIIYKDFGSNRTKTIKYKNPDKSEHDLQVGKGFISLMALGLPNILKVFQYDSIEALFTDINKAIADLDKIINEVPMNNIKITMS